jgi:hypothetical protein
LFTFNTSSQEWQAVTNTFGKLNAGDAYRIMIRGSRNTDMTMDNNNPPATDTKLRATVHCLAEQKLLAWALEHMRL